MLGLAVDEARLDIIIIGCIVDHIDDDGRFLRSRRTTLLVAIAAPRAAARHRVSARRAWCFELVATKRSTYIGVLARRRGMLWPHFIDTRWVPGKPRARVSGGRRVAGLAVVALGRSSRRTVRSGELARVVAVLRRGRRGRRIVPSRPPWRWTGVRIHYISGPA